MAREDKTTARDGETVSTDRLIGSKEIVKIVPYSLFHLSRLEAAGKFPRRIKLGNGRISWSLREVEAWISARKADRDSAPAG